MKHGIATFTDKNLSHIAFPLGGVGAGMFCLQGNGMLGNFSLRNEPDINNEPNVFSALCVKHSGENVARVIEGQIPVHKIFSSTSAGQRSGKRPCS